MAEIVLTEANNDGTASVSPGDVIAVRLQENPTTGHRWQVDGSGTLLPVGDDFRAGSGLGAAGERILCFSAVTQGSSDILLTLRRPWEKNGSPQGRFRVSVEVK